MKKKGNVFLMLRKAGRRAYEEKNTHFRLKKFYLQLFTSYVPKVTQNT